MTSEEIINLIKDIRKRRKLTQIDMAERLDIAQSMYSKYERGESEMPLSIFLKVMEILEIEVFKPDPINLVSEKDWETIQDIIDKYRKK